MKLMLPLGVKDGTSIQRRILLQGIIMNGMQKVLVVDNGERAPDSALSANFAELEYAALTAPSKPPAGFLPLIPTPAPVVLQIPRGADWSEPRRSLKLAARLRKTLAASRTPVIVTGGVNGAVAMLQNELGTRAVAAPDL